MPAAGQYAVDLMVSFEDANDLGLMKFMRNLFRLKDPPHARGPIGSRRVLFRQMRSELHGFAGIPDRAEVGIGPLNGHALAVGIAVQNIAKVFSVAGQERDGDFFASIESSRDHGGVEGVFFPSDIRPNISQF